MVLNCGVFHVNMSKISTDAANFSLEKHYEDFLSEKIHSNFCKFIPGVTKYSSNLVSKAKLGRYSVVIYLPYCIPLRALFSKKIPVISYGHIVYSKLITILKSILPHSHADRLHPFT